MFRNLSLALLTVSLVACATAPTSDTESLVQNAVEGASSSTCAQTYCALTGTRIVNPRRYQFCSCSPPASLNGIPVGR
jgi:hypothetical protein